MTVEADIMSDRGAKDVVEKVRKGELPAFQHVYAAGESVLHQRFDMSVLADEKGDCVMGSRRVVRNEVYT